MSEILKLETVFPPVFDIEHDDLRQHTSIKLALHAKFIITDEALKNVKAPILEKIKLDMIKQMRDKLGELECDL
jgi:hypothetical protein